MYTLAYKIQEYSFTRKETPYVRSQLSNSASQVWYEASAISGGRETLGAVFIILFASSLVGTWFS